MNTPSAFTIVSNFLIRYLLIGVFVLCINPVQAGVNTAGNCSGFRTQTQGGWGQCQLNGYNPGSYLATNFAAAFPSGLTVGCTNTLVLTTALGVCEFIPSSSTPTSLPSGTLTNPASTYSNILAGQVVALTLNLGFDQYDPNFSTATTLVKNLVIANGTFAGWTAQQLLDEANRKLGGCTSSYSFSDLNDAASNINENYIDGLIDGGFLICCSNLSASISSQTNVLCFAGTTGSVSLSASSGTTPYQYKIGSGSYQSSNTFSSLVAGSYIVTIKDARNCTTTQSVTITQPSTAITATRTQTNVFCYGGSTGAVSITATGGTSAYQYKLGSGTYQTSGTFTGLIAGSYTITIKDANNCTTTKAVIITQPSSALAASIGSLTNVLCYGNSTGSVSITATGGTSTYQYKLGAGAYQTSNTFSSLVAGSYTVTVKDANNCTITQAVTITQPSSALSASISTQT
ncbi:MAG: SprB repeat-containing protein, partial [Bacteroidia bacterium]|nr:SprB repeat-containing protein [Bacteroidia bacterium]